MIELSYLDIRPVLTKVADLQRELVLVELPVAFGDGRSIELVVIVAVASPGALIAA